MKLPLLENLNTVRANRTARLWSFHYAPASSRNACIKRRAPRSVSLD